MDYGVTSLSPTDTLRPLAYVCHLPSKSQSCHLSNKKRWRWRLDDDLGRATSCPRVRGVEEAKIGNRKNWFIVYKAKKTIASFNFMKPDLACHGNNHFGTLWHGGIIMTLSLSLVQWELPFPVRILICMT